MSDKPRPIREPNLSGCNASRCDDSERIPLMFQAQLKGRGKIQYAGDAKPATEWVNQWLKGCPPVPNTPEDNVPVWRRTQPQPTVKIPQFGAHVQTWKYTLNWRLVTNCGQDEDIIRPVIGAKGLPYYPGSSMKGAFLRACTPEEALKYCGGDITNKGEKHTKPGILRFHGGYPVDMSWGDKQRLIDVIHSQQNRQVIEDGSSSANVQISLYKTTFKFGISSNEILDKQEWERIKSIWEQALEKGLGSRVSAGYGRFAEIAAKDKVILSVNLQGQGLTSKLLNGTPEFRPNMFKAVLRGHTLRLFAGITDKNTAQKITKQLWGGIKDKDDKEGAVVGKLGISFTVEDEKIHHSQHKYYPNGREKPSFMDTYNLKSGKLDILCIGEVSSEEKKKLKKFLTRLIMFSLLLGGFGKSWRRVDHRKFYQEYFQRHDKPMIGCHWEFTPESTKYYLTAATQDLNNLKQFLHKLPQEICEFFHIQSGNYVQEWREVWHPDKVQVWGKITQESEAIHWLHWENFIKRTELTGWIGGRNNPSKIGRIWHRMYPRYVNKNGILKPTDEYIELLTIFPETSENISEESKKIQQNFLEFLHNQTEFQQLY